MKKHLIAAVAAGVLSSAGHSLEIYKINPQETNLEFEIRQKSNSPRIGTFKVVTGIIEVDGTSRIESVEVNIDTTSVDMKSPLFNGYVKHPDLLGVREHPGAVFRSSDIRLKGSTGALAAGDLTLRGVTKPLELRIDDLKFYEIAGGNKACRVSGTATFKQSEFGMASSGPYVLDYIRIKISLKAYLK